MPTPRRLRSAAAVTARGVAAIGLAALLPALTTVVADAGAQTTTVSAAPAVVAPPASALSLTDVTGARVARGAAAGSVHAAVRNSSPTTATGVVVRYRLPVGVEFAPDASSVPCLAGATLVTCVVGSVPGQATRAVDIGVRVVSPTAVLGTRSGYFLPPTSDAFDPAAGEVEERSWNHEVGAEGTDLRVCWPVGRPAPMMDVAGGSCDGIVDAPEPAPDAVTVLGALPPAFSQPVNRSWQFETEITAPSTGTYHACGLDIDDGGYLAIAPEGQPFSPSSSVLSSSVFATAVGGPFPLEGGRRYRVLIRVVNRGLEGIDNGSAGGTPGGWTAFGITPATAACGAADAAVFGTADSAWVDRVGADVVIVGSSNLSVLGMVESASFGGRRTAAVRVANVGRDATAGRLTLRLPAGASAARFDGCDAASADPAPSCDLSLPPGSSSDRGRIVTVGYGATTTGFGWSLTATSTVDADPSGDAVG